MHRMESFSRNGVGVDNKEVISTRRERIVSGQVIFFGGGRGMQGSYTDSLTSADQEIQTDWLMPLPGKAETAFGLGVESWWDLHK